MRESKENTLDIFASMKVPPKRKGNEVEYNSPTKLIIGLNESPSEKEGKFAGSV